eukprot:1322026-Prymnesium_polylepis.2
MLGAVRPNAMGMVADTVPFKQQGRAFGIMLACSCFGAVSGTGYATAFSERTLFGGMRGWRVVLLTLVVLSWLLLAVTVLFARDPRGNVRSERAASSLGQFFGQLRQLLAIRSFVTIALCGTLCVIPFQTGN